MTLINIGAHQFEIPLSSVIINDNYYFSKSILENYMLASYNKGIKDGINVDLHFISIDNQLPKLTEDEIHQLKQEIKDKIW